MNREPKGRGRAGGWSFVMAAIFVAACGPVAQVEVMTLEPGPYRHRVTAEGVLASARVTPISVPAEVQGNVRVAWVAEEGIRIQAGDLVARFDDGAMRDQLTEGEAERTTVSHRKTKGEVERMGRNAEIDNDLQVAELELDVAQRFQLEDDSVFSRQEIIESQIDGALAEDRRDHALDSHVSQRALAATNQALLAIEERKADLKITQAEGGLQALEVRAPHDGLLTLKRDWQGEPVQVGSELWRGQAIAEIPDLSTLEAQVFVLEADAGGLAPGKAASVVVDAQPDVTYAATITQVDAVAKPRFRGSPVQYFGVTLAFEGDVDTTGLKPGQRLRAILVLAEEAEALVVPRQAVFATEGENHVWVRVGGGFESRAVEIGASSLGLVELVGGVTAGDVVALESPFGGGETESTNTPGDLPATGS